MHGRSINRGKKSVLARMFLLVVIVTALTLGIYSFADATGFLYYISITGITGTAAPKIDNIKIEMEKIRKTTKLPIAVGFGISKPQQALEIALFADGVVIGSAVVRLIDENKNNPDLIKIVSGYISGIKKVLR